MYVPLVVYNFAGSLYSATICGEAVTIERKVTHISVCWESTCQLYKLRTHTYIHIYIYIYIYIQMIIKKLKI